MNSFTKIALASFACAFLTRGVTLGSTFTSVTCSVIIGAQTINQTNASACLLDGSLSYRSLAFAQAYMAPGFYYSQHLGADISTDTYEEGGVTATASADAGFQQEFGSAGPMRMGTITFYSACVSFYNPFQLADKSCGGVTLADSIQTTFVDSGCDSYYYCQTETLPIELGTTFSIGAYISDSQSNALDFLSSVEVNSFFRLNELDGAPVTAQLVPEPEMLCPAGLAIAAMWVAAKLKRAASRLRQ